MISPEEGYVDAVLRFVHFRYDHAVIRKELLAHLEDKADWLAEQGTEREEAVRLAVEEMGDPSETGRALNREHSPVLGWIWQISRLLARLAAALMLLLALWMAVDFLIPNASFVDKTEVEHTVELNAATTVHGFRYHLQKLLYKKNGDIVLLYESWAVDPRDNRWGRSISYVKDEWGRIYHVGSMSRGTFKSRHVVTMEGIPDEAAVLWANVGFYEEEWLEIPLNRGSEETDE